MPTNDADLKLLEDRLTKKLEDGLASLRQYLDKIKADIDEALLASDDDDDDDDEDAFLLSSDERS